jgi:hypothetical protein
MKFAAIKKSQSWAASWLKYALRHKKARGFITKAISAPFWGG